MAQALGNRMASQLLALAHGLDDRPVEPRRAAQSIGREETFAEDIHSREEAERILLSLSEEVGWRLRREGVAARTVTLKIRVAPFETYTRQQTFPELVSYDEDIFEAARALFRAFSLPPGAGIRLLGVSAGGLATGGEVSLFDDHEKKDKLYDAIDKLKGRFGENILTRAALAKPKDEP